MVAMKVGNLVATRHTSELGFIVGVDETHCDVFIPKVKRKRNRTFRISKEALEVIDESR
tara:strand:- start:931 stop:1107 length:177 start_codon:yes stop_codon:yes gene_type:complete